MGWLSDIGNAVASAAGAVGDVVEGAASAVADAGHDVIDAIQDGADSVLHGVNDWLCDHAGNVGCRIGNVVFGGLSGLVHGLHDVFDSFFDVIGHLGGFAGALLRGDVAGALGQLVAVALDVVNLVLAVGRLYYWPLSVYRGIRDYWNAETLRRFVEDLLAETFGADPDKLERIREHLSMDERSSWGLPVVATHRTFCLDSEVLPLHEWHRDGTIDLYSLAGVANTSFTVWRRRTAVHVMSRDGIESSLPANRWQIAKYLESNGKSGRLRVYALSRDAIKDYVRASEEKGRQVGLKLDWNEGTRWDQFDFSRQAHLVSLEDGSGPPNGFHFNRFLLERFLIDKGYRAGTRDEECALAAFAAFDISDGGRGYTAGRDIQQGSAASPCASQPHRDDGCCSTVDSSPGRSGSGVVYRDAYPPVITRYSLIHEIGHYVGLCHYNHSGVQNIMFTAPKADADADLSWFDWGELNYLVDNEPRFTLDDGKNAWRFIVAELSHCLDPDAPEEPPPIL